MDWSIVVLIITSPLWVPVALTLLALEAAISRRNHSSSHLGYRGFSWSMVTRNTGPRGILRRTSKGNHHMKPKQAIQAIKHHLAREQVCFLLGPPGVGKSKIVEQAVREFYGLDAHLALLIGSQAQPTDLKGYPVPNLEAQAMQWLLDSTLPTTEKSCIFADEITSAPVLVQSALLQLFGPEKCVGTYNLPKGAGRIGAGNRAQDGAGAGKLITPMADRGTILEIEVDSEQWVAWAIRNGIDPRVVAYIRWNMHTNKPALHDWDPKRSINATPRSWEAVSTLLEGCPDEIREEIIAGNVGQGHAATLEGFIRLWGKLPDPDGILLDPEHGPIPDLRSKDGPALMFALCSALAQRTKPNTGAPIVRYAKRLQPEFGLSLIRDAQGVDNGAICNTKEFQKWALENQDLYA